MKHAYLCHGKKQFKQYFFKYPVGVFFYLYYLHFKKFFICSRMMKNKMNK